MIIIIFAYIDACLRLPKYLKLNGFEAMQSLFVPPSIIRFCNFDFDFDYFNKSFYHARNYVQFLMLLKTFVVAMENPKSCKNDHFLFS